MLKDPQKLLEANIIYILKTDQLIDKNWENIKVMNNNNNAIQ